MPLSIIYLSRITFNISRPVTTVVICSLDIEFNLALKDSSIFFLNY